MVSNNVQTGTTNLDVVQGVQAHPEALRRHWGRGAKRIATDSSQIQVAGLQAYSLAC